MNDTPALTTGDHRGSIRVVAHVRLKLAVILGSLTLLVPSPSSAEPQPCDRYLAGVATVVITPAEPMWAAGYGSRKHAITEKVHDLHAKALLLQDAVGERVLIVTTDLIGFSRSLAESVAGRIMQDLRLRRDQIVLTASHTHCGPALRDSLVNLYPMTKDDWDVVHRYTAWLEDRIVGVARLAAERLEPAHVLTGKGRATFAVNRRENKEQDVVPGYRPKGPVDHEVPVLRIDDVHGHARAILFGYACHNTTMNFYKWCGDYAGFAQLEIELRHPGTTALFVQGCGGDSNPLPRRTIELCQGYGRQLADAVDRIASQAMTPIQGLLATTYEEIDLPLIELPDRAGLQAQLTATYPAERAFAKGLLRLIDSGGSLQELYRYPVHAVRIGDQLTIVALGGEVVVDYSLRIKRELDPQKTWVLGYCNDTMGYIPSRRVLAEGGYEGATSMYAYGLPGRWSPAIEDLIVATVHRLVSRLRSTTCPSN